MATKKTRKRTIRVGTLVEFIDGDVSEIQPGGVDFGVPRKVLEVDETDTAYPFTVESKGACGSWVAKREWLRIVPRKKRKAAK